MGFMVFRAAWVPGLIRLEAQCMINAKVRKRNPQMAGVTEIQHLQLVQETMSEDKRPAKHLGYLFNRRASPTKRQTPTPGRLQNGT